MSWLRSRCPYALSKIFVLGLLFALPLGCLQTENSSTMDKGSYSDISGTAEFLKVREIFSNSCSGSSCHSFHTMSEHELEIAGFFEPGDPANSKLYYRLIGSDGTNPDGKPKSMPPSGGLSGLDVSQIQAWIENAQ